MTIFPPRFAPRTRARRPLAVLFGTAALLTLPLAALPVAAVAQSSLSAPVQTAPAQATAAEGTVRGLAKTAAFKQAIAAAAAEDEAIATFYRQTDYQQIFTGPDDAARREALLSALATAGDHALPVARYDLNGLMQTLRDVRSQRDLGRAEVAAARAFLSYARDVQTGALEPSRVDSGIVRDIPRRDPVTLLQDFADAQPRAYMRGLAPRTPEYARLMKEKMRLQRLIAAGGWGEAVRSGALKPGAEGAEVIALRNRLIAMDYLPRTVSVSYDAAMQQAVQRFQADHGLETDGVAGPSTLQEVNVPASKRLESVVVAMERERWLNFDRGSRHVLVNIADFSAKIVDDGEVTFRTRSVVGADASDRRTPEFSDQMEHMVINPTWHIPRSIVTKEYLPQMQRNPNAVSHLNVVDNRGRVVPRGAVNFRAYTARTFPFAMKQPPSQTNALGLVKFMFPNKYNIYLHDTPSKSLFARESRAFSHGCVRLGDPFDFAYALLAPQTDNPEAFFQAKLRSGQETTVKLDQPVPVHLIYRTAVAEPQGKINFRRDVYGRDARLFDALVAAGVVLSDLES
ncbi:MAG: murein L,D-transpeptidase [Confluentimicrobium sp.]|nr:murein L,D-transpeptidase [Actibacterium sp.]